MNNLLKNRLILILLVSNLVCLCFIIILSFNFNNKLDFIIDSLLLERISANQEIPRNIPEFAVDKDPSFGQPEAPVKIVMFSDYQCGYCKVFFDSVFNKIQQDYINKGLVTFYIKTSPHKSNSFSFIVAQAAKLAQNEGKFEAFHEILFSKQPNLSLKILEESLLEIGIDTFKLRQIINEKTFDLEIKENISVRENNGITGIPAFVINDKLYVGNRDFAAFKVIIDKEISQSLSSFDELCE